MKVLFIATYGDFLATFELSNIKLWQEMGFEVHCAADFDAADYNRKVEALEEIGVVRHQIAFERSPLRFGNLRALREVARVIRRNAISVVDAHNAVAGAIARVAAHWCRVPRVVYTPHSFFFYSGAPRINQVLFRTAESALARGTDLLVALNAEDFKAARGMKIRGEAVFVPGVGINVPMIQSVQVERAAVRSQLGLPDEATIFLSVGELIPRKNHVTVIDAFAQANLTDARLLICGIGALEESLKDRIHSHDLDGRVLMLGYRTDVIRLMRAADVFVLASFQEGLPVALLEAMASGLPCLVSRIRGNTDLIEPNRGGYLFEPRDFATLASQMVLLDSDASLRDEFARRNSDAASGFDVEAVRSIMRHHYAELVRGMDGKSNE